MKIFIFFSFISTVISVDINNPRSCPISIQEPDKTTCCDNLNNKRDDFTKCCNYPIMVVYRDDYDDCTNQCTKNGKEATRCCLLSCCFKKLGIIADNSSIINTQGLINSFTMSVKNPNDWSDKIGCVVENCTRMIEKPPPTTDTTSDDYKNYWDCFEQIPMYFYDIVDCAYDYNFIYCPNYPFNQGKCYETFYYVNDCFVNDSPICGSPANDPRTSNNGEDPSNDGNNGGSQSNNQTSS
ncbi:hypothetical protein PVAND_017186 [Polypedilum vanderplanki]|uniref:Uncharacterized protein n=1 Tax=Polypedilum vanderplanki TaxID=319348 RepID=A0A9J6BHW7_POLVA|nr:hypothetical protein PVAND_017186 [Polypedilum vanderplanki]